MKEKEVLLMIRFNQEYYDRVVKQNGYEFCTNLEMPLPGLSVSEMQKWLCVYNLSPDIVSTLDKKDTLFIAGVGVNREPHIGTISQLLRIFHKFFLRYSTLRGPTMSPNAKIFKFFKLTSFYAVIRRLRVYLCLFLRRLCFSSQSFWLKST